MAWVDHARSELGRLAADQPGWAYRPGGEASVEPTGTCGSFSAGIVTSGEAVGSAAASAAAVTTSVLTGAAATGASELTTTGADAGTTTGCVYTGGQ